MCDIDLKTKTLRHEVFPGAIPAPGFVLKPDRYRVRRPLG